MIHLLPVAFVKFRQIEARQKWQHWVIEVTNFNSKVRFDLLGCFEAAKSSEASKRVHSI